MSWPCYPLVYACSFLIEFSRGVVEWDQSGRGVERERDNPWKQQFWQSNKLCGQCRRCNKSNKKLTNPKTEYESPIQTHAYYTYLATCHVWPPGQMWLRTPCAPCDQELLCTAQENGKAKAKCRPNGVTKSRATNSLRAAPCTVGYNLNFEYTQKA